MDLDANCTIRYQSILIWEVCVKLLEGISTKIAHASPGLQDIDWVIKKK